MPGIDSAEVAEGVTPKSRFWTHGFGFKSLGHCSTGTALLFSQLGKIIEAARTSFGYIDLTM
jgi:hypothetical protein